MRLGRHLLTIAVAAVIAGAFFAALIISGGSEPSLSAGGYEIRALVPTAASLGPGAEVRVAGLQVGRVSSVERRGSAAVIKLNVDEDQRPLPSDSRFAIRLRSLVGENYVELYPGTSKSGLPDDAVLPMGSQAFEYVDLEQILDVLRGSTRERARRLMQGLGNGVRGRGRELNALVGGTSAAITKFSPVLRVLAKDHEQVGRLVQQLGDVSRAIGDRGAAIRTLARQGRATAEAVATRDGALRATLVELAPTLSQVRSTSQILRSATRDSTPVLADLAAAVREVRPAVKLLRPAAVEGREVVHQLGDAAPGLRGTLGRVRSITPATVKALPELKRLLCETNPALKYLAPYSRELATTLQAISSATNYYDANGHAGRLMPIVGEYSNAPQTAQQSDAVRLLLDSGLLGRQRGQGYNPYPEPGQTGPPTSGKGRLGPADVKEPYPHITAEC